MEFTETRIAGVFLVGSEVFVDDRGAFVVVWMEDAFAAKGLESRYVQVSSALTHERGSIRGLHYQAAPFEEAKLVRATQGAVFDVAVDLRPLSPTYGQWVGCELSAANRLQMYVPRGCAHGYQTLEADTEVTYLVSAKYSPPHQRGVRWNDPAFGIEWPLGAPARISDRDAGFPDFERVAP